jgi:hypothetical protein
MKIGQLWQFVANGAAAQNEVNRIMNKQINNCGCGQKPKLVQMTDSERPNVTWIECKCGMMTDSVIGEPKEKAVELAAKIWNGAFRIGPP